MTLHKTLAAILLLGSLAACGSAPVSRNAAANFSSPEAATEMQGGVAQEAVPVVAAPQTIAIERVEIIVPQSLAVSEEDSLVPNADIVWRGEPLGDRHAQVQAMFQAAAESATQGMQDGRGAVLSVVVTRFHGVTEKARYLTGGNYAMRFEITLRDAVTGEIIDGPRRVVADCHAAGGVRAIAEDNAGRTERVVVIERLAEVMRYEILHPVTAL